MKKAIFAHRFTNFKTMIMRRAIILFITALLSLTANAMMYHYYVIKGDVNEFYTKYYGITMKMPTNFHIASYDILGWQPSFQLKDAEGWRAGLYFRGLPSISFMYSNPDESTWMLIGDMESNESDSLYKEKIYGDMRLAQHLPENATLNEMLKNVKVFTGQEAAKIMNADTVYVATYKFEVPQIPLMHKGSFTHCIAVYAMKAGYTSYVGYILTNDTSEEAKQKNLKTLADAMHYVDGWTATKEITSTRHEKSADYIEKVLEIK